MQGIEKRRCRTNFKRLKEIVMKLRNLPKSKPGRLNLCLVKMRLLIEINRNLLTKSKSCRGNSLIINTNTRDYSSNLRLRKRRSPSSRIKSERVKSTLEIKLIRLRKMFSLPRGSSLTTKSSILGLEVKWL